MTLIALHGFLGLPTDWDHLSLISFPILPADSFQAWAEQFHTMLLQKVSPPYILMGYSMGGRLALHAMQQRPDLYKAGILISAHPGLKSEKEKQLQLKNDDEWADRFMQTPWDDLMKAWEEKEVFQNATHRFLRKEKDYARQDLAAFLRNFSLGHQEVSIPPIPIYWITGENDKKYTQLAQEISQLHPLSKNIVIPSASHRVPWENPKKFSIALSNITL